MNYISKISILCLSLVFIVSGAVFAGDDTTFQKKNGLYKKIMTFVDKKETSDSNNTELTGLFSKLKKMGIEGEVEAKNQKQSIISSENSGIIEKEIEIENVTPPWYSGSGNKPQAAKDGTNYCGQYALSTIFSALGIEYDFNTMFKEMNPASIYTAPDNFIEYANEQGADCRGVNNATDEAIKEQLDNGHPVGLFVRSGSTMKSLHWIAVTGYRIVDGKTEWKISDSYWGIGEKKGYVWMKDEKFQEKRESYFDNGGLLDQNITYNKYAVFFDKKESFFSRFDTAFEDVAVGATNDVVIGWKNKNWKKMTAGLIEGSSALVSLPAVLQGRLLKTGGQKLDDWGKKTADKGGFWNSVGGNGARVVGKTAKVVGTGFDTVGKGISWVGNKIGSLF